MMLQTSRDTPTIFKVYVISYFTSHVGLTLWTHWHLSYPWYWIQNITAFPPLCGIGTGRNDGDGRLNT